MKVNTASSTYTVQTKQAARVLQNQKIVRFLHVFLISPRSLKQASDVLGQPISSCLRMAKILQEHALLTLHSEQPRAGRAIKMYIAPAARFFVPYMLQGEFLPEELLLAMAQERMITQSQQLIAAARKTAIQNNLDTWGTLIYSDQRGQLIVRPDVDLQRTPAFLDNTSEAYANFYAENLRLSTKDAKQLQHDLVQLFLGYKGKSGNKSYSLSLVFAPSISKVIKRSSS